MTDLSQKVKSEELQIEPERLAGSDPLLKLLARTRVSPSLLGIVYSATFRLVCIFAAWRAGTLRTTGVTTGLFDDPGFYANFVYGAVIWAYYIWMPRRIAEVFKTLYNNGVVGAPKVTGGKKHTYTSFTVEMQSSFNRWWWPVTSLAVAAGATFILLLPRYLVLGQTASWTADILSLIISLLWVLIGLYCVLLLLTHNMLTLYWLNRLFKCFEIKIRPLHPDRAGGLSSLGNFSLSSSYLIALVGIILVVTAITRNYIAVGTLQFHWTTELLVGLGIYVVAAPAVFFAPLSVAHRAMKDAKDGLLLRIGWRFETEYANIQSALGFPNDSVSRFC